MALQMDLAISWLLVMSYSSSFVLSHHRCIPEDAYSISCATRPPAFTDAELCTSSLTYEVVDRNAGTVAFSLLFPFNESNVSTELIILSLRSSDGTECSTDVEGVHSKFTLAVDGSGFKQQNKNGSNNVNCHHNEVKKLEWKSSYLFTGCYRIDLNLNYECKSKPFRVESGFIKEVFANRSLQLFAYSSGQNVFAIYNFGIKFCHNYPQTTIVYLRSNSTYPRKRLACCFTGESVSHCHWFREEHGELVDCSCSWTEESLSCTFMEVPPGNYSIELDIIDTRCNRGTIWTGGWEKNDEEPCLWKHEPIEVKNNTLGDFPFVSPAVSFTSPWLMSIVALTAAGIGLSVYCRWRWRRRLPLLPRSSQNAADTIDIHEKLLDPPKVLLLYARDSPCFMSAMAAFRQLLRDNISAQVYDLWEDRFQDQIDAQGEVWASKFLYSENVRIVVFATPVSRRIEEALMNGLEINYRLSDHRDETFLFTFKTAMSLVPRIKEPCNKFLVVRLHRNNCSEDVLQNFSTNSTVYTLPTHLQKLIFHLLQSQSVGVALNLKNAELLNDRIVVYGKFVSSHPEYFDDILNPVEIIR